LLTLVAACQTTAVAPERPAQRPQDAPSLEGVWEGEESVSTFTVGGRAIEVPNQSVFEITSVAGDSVRGFLTVHVFLSRSEDVPDGVSDASQTFDVRGTYAYPRVTLTVYKDDGTVNAENHGTVSEEGRTLRLASTKRDTTFVYVKQIDEDTSDDDDA
jgi:hypothetical protein